MIRSEETLVSMNMKIAVKLFAAARELAGQEEIVAELATGATVAQLRENLTENCPELCALLPHALFAIDNAYAQELDVVSEGSEVACIPPVSGG